MSNIEVHESGHCVLGHLMGRRVTNACVIKSGNENGYMEFDQVGMDPARWALTGMAGAAAEAKLKGCDFTKEYFERDVACSQDYRKVSTNYPEWATLIPTVNSLVEKNWDKILYVAGCLKTRGSMDEYILDQIL